MTNNPHNILTNSPNRDKPDKGSKKMSLIAWVVGMLSFAGIVTVQQGVWTKGEPPVTPVVASDGPQLVPPGDMDPEVVSARALVRVRPMLKELPGVAGALRGASPGSTSPIAGFRRAIVTAELEGAEAAKAELDAITQSLDAATRALTAAEVTRLQSEIAAVRSVLEGKGESLTAVEREALVADHGYFGKLILTFGKPDTDPDRATLVRGGGFLVFVFSLYGAVLLLALVGGLVALILLIVRARSGRIRSRFRPPEPGGSVYIETFAVFATIFLLVQITFRFVPAAANLGPGVKQLCQWPVVLVVLWPLLRGVRFPALRLQMGWHAGAGVFREIWVGLFFLLAAMPLVALAYVVMLAIMLSQMRSTGQSPQNPIQQILSQSSPAELVNFFLLATLWAPIVEEAIFRGALFRHLRSRHGVLITAAVTALAFGFMHGYSVAMIIPVTALGIAFALIREWRGSLIPSMAAHCAFNATQLTIGILVMEALK